MKHLSWWLLTVVFTTSAWCAPVWVDLKSAIYFGLLGGTISNTGTSLVMGNVGVKDATGTITGFNPTGTTVGGVVMAPGTPQSTVAYMDFVSAFNAGQLLASTQTYADLSMNRTFVGNNVYTFSQPNISSTTGINLTFDAQNDPNAAFVIRTDGALTVNGSMNFILQNQARADHIFWIIGTIATISPGSSGPETFGGNILAGQSFTMSAGAGGSGVLAGTVNGCVFSQTANTLAGTTNINGCSGLAPSSVPEPSTFALGGFGCLLVFLVRRSIARSDLA